MVLLDRSASMGLQGGTAPIDRGAGRGRGRSWRGPGRGRNWRSPLFDRAVSPARAAGRPAQDALEPTRRRHRLRRRDGLGATSCVRSRKASQGAAHPDRSPALRARPGRDREPPRRRRGPPRRLRPAFPKNVAVTAVTIAPDDRPARRVCRGHGDGAQRLAPAGLPSVPSGSTSRTATERDDGPKTDRPRRRATGDRRVPAATSCPRGSGAGMSRHHRGDDLPFDDRRFLALSVAPRRRLLLVDGDPAGRRIESETYFLQAALRLVPPGERYAKSPFDVRTIDSGGYGRLPGPGRRPRRSCWRTSTTSARRMRERLAEFVDKAADCSSSRATASTGRGPRALARPAWASARSSVPECRPSCPGGSSAGRRPPDLRPFADPEHGDLRRPAFTAITRIKPDPEARVLAWFRGGEPALLERTQGTGKVLWFASACDRAWGDWPRGRMYLPMVHQMLAYVSGLAEGGRIRQEIADGRAEAGRGRVRRTRPCRQRRPVRVGDRALHAQEFADRFGFRLPSRQRHDSRRRARAGRPTIACGATRSGPGWP